MSKQGATTEKSTTKQPIKTPLTNTPAAGLAAVAPESLSLYDAPSLAGQASRLGNGQLQAVQRQMLAGQIGQMQGNGHMQQVLAFVKQNEQQRENQFTTDRAPYQSNSVENRSAPAGNGTIHRSSHAQPATHQPEQSAESDLEATPTDEELASLWGEGDALNAAATGEPPETPPQPSPVWGGCPLGAEGVLCCQPHEILLPSHCLSHRSKALALAARSPCCR